MPTLLIGMGLKKNNFSDQSVKGRNFKDQEKNWL
jgi:hypothetical protein